MKKHSSMLILVFVLMVMIQNIVIAQDSNNRPGFSNKGIKAALGSGSTDVISERGLEAGAGGALSLGYGFTDNFSLWLSLVGSKHKQTGSDVNLEFGGMEINLQQKFNAHSAWQPYSKVGFGLYGLEEKNSDNSLIGAGINLGLGIDYFFSKHIGVGAEFTYKKLDYFAQSRKTEEGDLITDIYPNLNGDTTGFMLTLTVQ